MQPIAPPFVVLREDSLSGPPEQEASQASCSAPKRSLSGRVRQVSFVLPEEDEAGGSGTSAATPSLEQTLHSLQSLRARPVEDSDLWELGLMLHGERFAIPSGAGEVVPLSARWELLWTRKLRVLGEVYQQAWQDLCAAVCTPEDVCIADCVGLRCYAELLLFHAMPQGAWHALVQEAAHTTAESARWSAYLRAAILWPRIDPLGSTLPAQLACALRRKAVLDLYDEYVGGRPEEAAPSLLEVCAALNRTGGLGFSDLPCIAAHAGQEPPEGWPRDWYAKVCRAQAGLEEELAVQWEKATPERCCAVLEMLSRPLGLLASLGWFPSLLTEEESSMLASCSASIEQLAAGGERRWDQHARLVDELKSLQIAGEPVEHPCWDAVLEEPLASVRRSLDTCACPAISEALPSDLELLQYSEENRAALFRGLCEILEAHADDLGAERSSQLRRALVELEQASAPEAQEPLWRGFCAAWQTFPWKQLCSNAHASALSRRLFEAPPHGSHPPFSSVLSALWMHLCGIGGMRIRETSQQIDQLVQAAETLWMASLLPSWCVLCKQRSTSSSTTEQGLLLEEKERLLEAECLSSPVHLSHAAILCKERGILRWQELPERMLRHRECMLTLVTHDPEIYPLALGSAARNAWVVAAAIRKHPEAIRETPKAFQSSARRILRVLHANPHCLGWLSPELREVPALVLEAMHYDPTTYQYAGEVCRTIPSVRAAWQSYCDAQGSS